MSSNSRKAAFLGMPYGTANGRLKKMVLFDLLCQMKHNCCFKCKEEIKTPEELSIEHIKPWEGRSVELFWDLGNISFSHLRCNRPHIWNPPNKKLGVDGTAFCSGKCKTFKPVEDFPKYHKRFNGLDHLCKQCRSVKNASRIRK